MNHVYVTETLDAATALLPATHQARYQHHPRTQRPSRIAVEDLHDILPRVHRAISSLKTWLQGTHKHVPVEHLQVYLDTFVFRFNRRRTRWLRPDLARSRQPPAISHLRGELRGQSPAHARERSLNAIALDCSGRNRISTSGVPR